MTLNPAAKQSTLQAAMTGLVVFFIDNGISFACGAAVGAFFGAAGMSPTEIAGNPWLRVVGLIVSVYAAYLLVKVYSRDIRAFEFLIIVGALMIVISVYSNSLKDPSFNIVKEAVGAVAQLVSYFLGWYLAKSTKVQLYILPNGWLKAASILGGILVFFGLAMFVRVLNS